MAGKSEGNAAGVTEQGSGAGVQDTGTDGGSGAPEGGDDVAAILAFDPFAPPKAGAETPPAEDKTPPAPADKKGAAGTGTGNAPDSPTPKPGAAPAAQPAAPPAAKQDSGPDLAALFREQTAAIKSLVQPPAKEDKPTPEAPKFNLGIPPQILDAMNSEDPQERATATHALVNGVANAVWREVTAAVKSEIGQVLQGMPQLMEAHISARGTQQQIFNDFYSAHEGLSKPEFQPLVLSAAQLVFKELAEAGKQVTWGPEMRDAIAEKIYSSIPALRPAAPAKGNGGAPPAPAKPKFNPGGGARPSGGPTGPEADMLAILGRS